MNGNEATNFNMPLVSYSHRNVISIILNYAFFSVITVLYSSSIAPLACIGKVGFLGMGFKIINELTINLISCKV